MKRLVTMAKELQIRYLTTRERESSRRRNNKIESFTTVKAGL